MRAGDRRHVDIDSDVHERPACAAAVLAAATAVLLAVAVPATAGGSPALADVPVAAADTAVVSVKAGGLRTTSGNVDALAGVQLELRTDDQGSPGALVGTCQSDDDGDCSFVVGQTGSGGAKSEQAVLGRAERRAGRLVRQPGGAARRRVRWVSRLDIRPSSPDRQEADDTG